MRSHHDMTNPRTVRHSTVSTRGMQRPDEGAPHGRRGGVGLLQKVEQQSDQAQREDREAESEFEAGGFKAGRGSVRVHG